MRELLGALALLATLAPSAADACVCQPDIDYCARAELIVAVEIISLQVADDVTYGDARVLAVARGAPAEELRLEWHDRDSCDPLPPEVGELFWVLLPDADDLRVRMCSAAVRPFTRENLDEVPCDEARDDAFEAALRDAEASAHASRAGCGSCAVGSGGSPMPPLFGSLALSALLRLRRDAR